MDEKTNKLIGRYLSGNTNSQENKWVEDWLSRSPSNKSEFEKTRRVWEAAYGLKKDRDTDVDAAWSEFRQLANKPLPAKRTYRIIYRIAAGIALFAMLGIIIWLVVPEEQKYNSVAQIENIRSAVPTETTMVTDSVLAEFDALLDSTMTSGPHKSADVSKRRKASRNIVMITVAANDSAKAFKLPDNSIVFLNDHSSLTYEENFGKNNRKVSLVGEAYFEPVKDTMRLMVYCGKTVARGTDAFFNVKEDLAKKTVEVLVVSGMVDFSGVGKKEYKKLVLNSGEKAVYNQNQVISVSKNIQNETNWWQKKNLRAKFKRLLEKFKRTFK